MDGSDGVDGRSESESGDTECDGGSERRISTRIPVMLQLGRHPNATTTASVTTTDTTTFKEGEGSVGARAPAVSACNVPAARVAAVVRGRAARRRAAMALDNNASA